MQCDIWAIMGVTGQMVGNYEGRLSIFSCQFINEVGNYGGSWALMRGSGQLREKVGNKGRRWVTMRGSGQYSGQVWEKVGNHVRRWALMEKVGN